MATNTHTPGGTPIPTTCVVGGSAPGGNASPCQTIAIDLVEAWKIDEGSGSVAAGVMSVADLALTPHYGTADQAWNDASGADGGRAFFAGLGVATLSPSLNLLKYVGDAITIAQRRWFTGIEHVQAPMPFASVGFGTIQYHYFNVAASSGISPPSIFAFPSVDFSAGASGPWPVIRRSLFRGSTPTHTEFPGTSAGLPGMPALYPPTPEPSPYLVVVTATMIAPDVISFSVFGSDGVYTFTGRCYNSNGDGSVSDNTGGPTAPPTEVTHIGSDTSPLGIPSSSGGSSVQSTFLAGDGEDAEVEALGLALAGGSGGAPTVLGPITTITIGGGGTGGVSGDTINEDGAALWKRALTATEIAWLFSGGSGGATLAKLFATIAEPGSQCSDAGECAEEGGIGTANPLIDEQGVNALAPTSIARTDLIAVLADDGDELRTTRRAATQSPRVYELVWDASQLDENDYERIREAVWITKHGATWTRWRHPIDDPTSDGTPCSAKRYRIRNAKELNLARGRGGHVGGIRLVLEEFV